MERGHHPDDVLAATATERNMLMAMAELNAEKQKDDIRQAVLEAAAVIFGTGVE